MLIVKILDILGRGKGEAMFMLCSGFPEGQV